MLGQRIKSYALNQTGQVPRYTSYPTAPHFIRDPEQAVREYKNGLDHIQDGEELSLYIHIPFCQKLCWYCGCNTNISMKYEPVESYTNRLIREIENIAWAINVQTKIKHIHFGGGSPSLLKIKEFQDIMRVIRENFTLSPDVEIAMEIDPRTVTEARVWAYAKEGINRVSIGVQDFNKKTLKAVNRPQPYHVTYQALQWFREYGIDNINIDLMYGLPHQTEQTICETIEKVASLNPDRVALFAYAHVPWMKKHMNQIKQEDLPDSESRFDLFNIASKELEARGMMPIGIDHFAKPEDELCQAYKNKTMRRNFQGYTTDTSETLLAFGASSISKFRHAYIQNYTEVSNYKSQDHAAQKFCNITLQHTQVSDLIQELMCYMNVKIPEGIEADLEMLSELQKQGIIKINNGHLTIEPEARQLVRIVCAAFDPEYQKVKDKQPRYAKAV